MSLTPRNRYPLCSQTCPCHPRNPCKGVGLSIGPVTGASIVTPFPPSGRSCSFFSIPSQRLFHFVFHTLVCLPCTTHSFFTRRYHESTRNIIDDDAFRLEFISRIGFKKYQMLQNWPGAGYSAVCADSSLLFNFHHGSMATPREPALSRGERASLCHNDA